jgi:hypothetical protein
MKRKWNFLVQQKAAKVRGEKVRQTVGKQNQHYAKKLKL